MAQKVQTKEIDGLEARTLKLPALAAYDLLTKLGEVITPLLSSLTGVDTDDLTDGDIDRLGAALQIAFKAIKGAEGRRLILETLSMTSVVVEGVNIELTSDARINEAFDDTGLLTMFKVIAFAIQVNYRDFIDAAKARVAAVKAKRQAAALLAEAGKKSNSPPE